MLTERDIAVISAVVRFFVLTREDIQRLCFSDDHTGRVARRRLALLIAEGYVNRYPTAVYNVNGGSPWPVYYPARRGAEFLAAHFEDEAFLATCTQTPQPYHLLHWIAVSKTHVEIEQAVARQKEVRLDAWFNEWDAVNTDETAPERRFRIYTLLRESPRLVCSPDAAFLLSTQGHSKVFFLEQDRATTSVKRIAALKMPGYALMAEKELHRRIFPATTLANFTVLMVSPTPGRRDLLRKAMRKNPGAPMWKFAATCDLISQRFLDAPIFYPCEGEPSKLVKIDTASASQ